MEISNKKRLALFFATNDFYVTKLETLSIGYDRVVPPSQVVVPWDSKVIDELEIWFKKFAKDELYVVFIFHVSMRADTNLLSRFLSLLSQFEFLMVLRGNESEVEIIRDQLNKLFNFPLNSLLAIDPDWDYLFKTNILVLDESTKKTEQMWNAYLTQLEEKNFPKIQTNAIIRFVGLIHNYTVPKTMGFALNQSIAEFHWDNVVIVSDETSFYMNIFDKTQEKYRLPTTTEYRYNNPNEMQVFFCFVMYELFKCL